MLCAVTVVQNWLQRGVSFLIRGLSAQGPFFFAFKPCVQHSDDSRLVADAKWHFPLHARSNQGSTQFGRCSKLISLPNPSDSTSLEVAQISKKTTKGLCISGCCHHDGQQSIGVCKDELRSSSEKGSFGQKDQKQEAHRQGDTS